MDKRMKATGHAKTIPAGLAIGCTVGMVLTLILSAVAAKLMDLEKIKETAVGYTALCILLVSSFACGLVASNAIKRRKLMVCGISALCYYLLLLSVTALFFGGQYQGMGMTALIVLCGGALSAMVSTRQGRAGHKMRKYKMANR